MSSSSPADQVGSLVPAPAAEGEPRTAPEPPQVAVEIFGDTLASIRAYAEILVGDGALRGVIGPREADRLWDRHLLNSALLADLVPPQASVIDVGSGGGLPGVVLALSRPDLRVTLIDSMQRRAAFLTDTVAALGIGERVTVVRGRAEEQKVKADVVVARAVADVGTLARWTARLCRRDGILLVLRGDGAADELAANLREMQRTGWKDAEIVDCVRAGVTSSRVIRAVRA